MYLHDLPEQFETVNNSVYLDGRAIDCLLYADNLIIVSKTAEGLQGSLSKLQEYCSFNSMTNNSDKTKIVLFNKPGKKLSKYYFHINGEHIDMATSYKYLGLTFSICGSFTTAKHELKKTAIKAFFKIRKEMGASFKSNVQISLKLFETLIKPILLYGSEVWGVDKYLPETKNPIEQVLKTFCKQLLGLNRKTSNLACRMELGQFSLKTDSQSNSIKFWTRIISLKDNSLRVKSYKEMLIPLTNDSWPGKICDILNRHGFGETWLIGNTAADINFKLFSKSFEQRSRDIARQECLSTLYNDTRSNSQQRNKLRTFRTFKDDISLENYLNTITNLNHRIALTKLRISSHKLMIEKGRYSRQYIPPEERLCPFCQSKTEDEKHFLLYCVLYDTLRESLFKKLNENIKEAIEQQSTETKFRLLIDHPAKLAATISKYIYNCLEKREEALSPT